MYKVGYIFHFIVTAMFAPWNLYFYDIFHMSLCLPFPGHFCFSACEVLEFKAHVHRKLKQIHVNQTNAQNLKYT